MQENLLEEVETYFTADTVSQASAVVGENERGVGRALAKIIPLVLSTFIDRAERPGGVEALWTLADEATDYGGFQELLTADRLKRRTELMRGLLGEDYAPTVRRLAEAARLKSSSVESLLSMAAQAVLQSLGTYAHEKALSADDLFAWLEGQKASIMSALALNTAPAAVPGPAPVPSPFVRPAGPVPPAAAAPAPAPVPATDWASTTGANPYYPPAAGSAYPTVTLRWMLLLLLIMAGAVLEYLFVRNRLSNNAAETPAAALAAPAPAAPRPVPTAGAGTEGRYDASSGNYIYDPGRPINLTLIDGTTQTVGVNSTENRLYTFLADQSIQVDSINRTKGWINFDRVYFDAKKATLTDESRSQLRNVASILKSFPTARVKIGGYTDITGNVLANLKLSEARANAAMAELVAMGIDLNRVEAKGYGGKHGVADNATPVGRALNRRISIRVTRK
ncbi:Outer membrane protein OmpA [Hymenobacter daecheongensis DSM 21074]|uniref:Outer membrane protein OmpA n=1 Tax=Hymenobacter daecheongensis DSM 21074 TaxID=1121955 RepID=A0A1M6H414_9BACT|nr:OmpA family protein [Hymenobacter daecheongensis]SHJ16903.1 Outer membrane protein OmpA [Hymenobacter daecheongensis DSM 21074]